MDGIQILIYIVIALVYVILKGVNKAANPPLQVLQGISMGSLLYQKVIFRPAKRAHFLLKIYWANLAK
jgi:hypothetical protein